MRPCTCKEYAYFGLKYSLRLMSDNSNSEFKIKFKHRDGHKSFPPFPPCLHYSTTHCSFPFSILKDQISPFFFHSHSFSKLILSIYSPTSRPNGEGTLKAFSKACQPPSKISKKCLCRPSWHEYKQYPATNKIKHG